MLDCSDDIVLHRQPCVGKVNGYFLILSDMHFGQYLNVFILVKTTLLDMQECNYLLWVTQSVDFLQLLIAVPDNTLAASQSSEFE